VPLAGDHMGPRQAASSPCCTCQLCRCRGCARCVCPCAHHSTASSNAQHGECLYNSSGTVAAGSGTACAHSTVVHTTIACRLQSRCHGPAEGCVTSGCEAP
jgi:hypothetical protein